MLDVVSHEGLWGSPALLWDLDNMPGRRWQLLSLARTLSLTVPNQAPRYAAARRTTWRWTEPLLMPFGFEVLSGGRSASGADRRLCDQGRVLRRAGHAQFIVVSNDKYFARLAALGDVHVVSLDTSNLSTRLGAAANSITELKFDGTGWVWHRVQEADADKATAPPTGSSSTETSALLSTIEPTSGFQDSV